MEFVTRQFIVNIKTLAPFGCTFNQHIKSQLWSSQKGLWCQMKDIFIENLMLPVKLSKFQFILSPVAIEVFRFLFAAEWQSIQQCPTFGHRIRRCHVRLYCYLFCTIHWPLLLVLNVLYNNVVLLASCNRITICCVFDTNTTITARIILDSTDPIPSGFLVLDHSYFLLQCSDISYVTAQYLCIRHSLHSLVILDGR